MNGNGTDMSIIKTLEVFLEVTNQSDQRNGFSSVPLVIVPDNYLDVGKVLFCCRLEQAQTQGLKPDVRVVKILNRRLDEQSFHCTNLDAPATSPPAVTPALRLLSG